MLNQLKDYIEKYDLFKPADKIIASVSGGIDSMVLIHLLHETGFSFAIGHCNFQLREEESDKDESFVIDAAKKYGVRIFTTRFDTASFARENGISIQMAARDLRRQWFEKLCEEQGYDKICTAHHLNDSLETVIFNLAKGTGISGIKGISPQSGRFVRPLLFASREMITRFAKDHYIHWREDRSNSSIKYARNKIRHYVVPELKKINPNLEATFLLSAEKLLAADEFYHEAIRAMSKELVSRQNGVTAIDIQRLTNVSHPAVVLYEIIKDYGFNFHQAKQIVEGIQNQSGRTFFSAHYQVVQDRQHFLVSTLSEHHSEAIFVDKYSVSASFGEETFVFEECDIRDFTMVPGPGVACLDVDLLKFPLKIRHWKKGDYFFPLGMNGKKKVSDFMIDKKIPVNLKAQAMTIFSGNDLIWLVGHRIDHRFRITDNTRKVLKITKIDRHD